MSLEFKVHSSEGIEKVAFDSIDDLLKCWGQNCTPDFVTGALTTFDGSYVIMPSNENSLDEVLNHYREHGVPVQYDSYIHEHVIGLDRDLLRNISKSMVDANISEPIHTELGTLKVIKRNTSKYEHLKPALEPNRQLLGKINQPMGSFYRDGTIVFDDENSECFFVFDTVGECVFADIQKREINKGETVTIWDADELGLHEDVKESRIYGDSKVIAIFKERIANLGMTDNYDIALDGFNNSKEFPLSDIGSALSQGGQELYIDSNGVERSITRVTKGVTLAAGSKGSSFYARFEDDVVEVKEGDYIGLSVETQKFGVLSTGEVQRMRKVDLDLDLAVPF
ncbi:hypothetical protein [Vibrio owensii]|uniref:hypothetical protein n=1 Tax=Vibrio owensii TaxID=696485 RepID=UPI003CC64CBD